MNCKKIKELLFTDYLDGRLGLPARTQVEKHLQECAGCRQLAEEIMQSAVAPFENLPKTAVPESVWQNIQEKIVEQESSRMGLFDLIVGKLRIFSLPRPAMALVSTMAICLVMLSGVMMKYNADKNQVKQYFAKHSDFYSLLNNGEGGSYQEMAGASSLENIFVYD